MGRGGLARDQGGKRKVKTLAENLNLPNGIEFHKGSLYVATPKDIVRYDNIVHPGYSSSSALAISTSRRSIASFGSHAAASA